MLFQFSSYKNSFGSFSFKRKSGDPERGPDSNPAVDAICGMSLLLVLSLAPRGFSPRTPQKPTLPNSKSIWNVPRRLNKFIRTPKCFVGKKNYNYGQCFN